MEIIKENSRLVLHHNYVKSIVLNFIGLCIVVIVLALMISGCVLRILKPKQSEMLLFVEFFVILYLGLIIFVKPFGVDISYIFDKGKKELSIVNRHLKKKRVRNLPFHQIGEVKIRLDNQNESMTYWVELITIDDIISIQSTSDQVEAEDIADLICDYVGNRYLRTRPYYY